MRSYPRHQVMPVVRCVSRLLYTCDCLDKRHGEPWRWSLSGIESRLFMSNSKGMTFVIIITELLGAVCV